MHKRPSAQTRKGTKLEGVRSPDLVSVVKLSSTLPRAFYNRNPQIVAQDLLGKLLVRRMGRRLLAGRIVETEAYLGIDDTAAHAYSGKTPRNAVLFGPPGHAYVYFIYGNHYCLNVSCMPEGDAGCVLLRAMEPLIGLEQMTSFRDLEIPPEPRLSDLRKIASGPGRMAEAMAITRQRDNGKDLTYPRGDLWIADDGYEPERIAATTRIGLTKAAEHELRYVIAGSPFVSGKRVL